MPSLRVRLEDPDTRRGEDYLFFKSPVRLGRNDLNDLPLGVGYVSQWHSVVRFDSSKIEYMDLGSTNGSFCGGMRVQAYSPIDLREGEPISIGKLRLTFALSDERPPAPVKASAAQAVSSETVADSEASVYIRKAFSAVANLRPAYQSYRQAWKAVLTHLQQVLPRLEPQTQSLLLQSFKESCPALFQEPEFRQLAASLKISLPAGADRGAMNVKQLGALLGIPAEKLPVDIDADGLLNKVAQVLDAFSTSFVELRRGLAQFSTELAVRTFRDTTPLHDASNGGEVLAYLVNPDDEGSSRVPELRGAFADMMIHQVAMITGIMDGVRGLLHKLGPDAIAEDLTKAPQRVGFLPVRRGMWPWSVTALWRRFVQRHQEFMEEDQQLSSVLFGRDFARSYGAARSERAEPTMNRKMRAGAHAGEQQQRPRLDTLNPSGTRSGTKS